MVLEHQLQQQQQQQQQQQSSQQTHLLGSPGSNGSSRNGSSLPNLPPEGLHSAAALQLYAAAAQLAPGGVRVPPWSPFLPFGVPGVFGGGAFLGRPRFENNAQNAAAASRMAASNAFANLTGLSVAAQTQAAAAVATVAMQHRLMIENRQNMPPGPPS